MPPHPPRPRRRDVSTLSGLVAVVAVAAALLAPPAAGRPGLETAPATVPVAAATVTTPGAAAPLAGRTVALTASGPGRAGTVAARTTRTLATALRHRGATVVRTPVGADLRLALQVRAGAARGRGVVVTAPRTGSTAPASRRLAAAVRDSLVGHRVPAARGAGRSGVWLVPRVGGTAAPGVPAVGVSLGDLDHRGDARRMTRAAGRATYAAALADAVTAELTTPTDPATSPGSGQPTTPPGAAQPATPPAPGAAGSTLPSLGVQVFSMWRDWPDHAALMDAAVRGGARSIRVDVGWCSLEEAGPGIVSRWYQDRLDTTIADARSRGLELLVTLTCAPAWAAGGREGLLPTDPAQYARVAGYLAARYRGQVAAWEIWNEPDCLDGGCPRGDVTAYAAVLAAAQPAIKSADPAALVVNGGLSGIDLDWIRRLFAAGAGRYLDALALHPYLDPANAAPDTPPVPGWTNPYRLTNVAAAHDLLVSLGHGDLPIWFTEMGWTTGRTPGSSYDGVTGEQQADRLTAAVALVRTRYPYVRAAWWFTLRDRDDSSTYENGFGLLGLDGSPKPAYAAFRAANGL